MNDEQRRVIGGIDAHTDTHHAAILDNRGALLGSKAFPVSAASYRDLLAWLESFGDLDRVGVESIGSYGAGLTRHLVAQGVRVLEVNQPMRTRAGGAARPTRSTPRWPLDTPSASRTQSNPSRQRGSSRRSVSYASRATAPSSRAPRRWSSNGLIITAPSGLREQLAARKSLKGQAALCRRLRPDSDQLADPATAAKIALRSLARRIALLDEEIAELDTCLQPLVASAAPRTVALLGISTGHAGQLLVTAGQNIDRLHGEGAFAALCGASPTPIASGGAAATASTPAATAKPTEHCT